MVVEWLGKIGSLLFMSLALSMDGFSISLGIGLQRLRLKRIAIIGFVIGLFHVMLPFLGIVIGQFISLKLDSITSVIGGFILVCIGSYMIFSALQLNVYTIIDPRGIKLFTIAFLVSIDTFPIGISLGLSGIKTVVIIFFFGISAMLLAWVGMLLGRKAHTLLGTYSEIFGGIILFIFGLHTIFN